jgi:hypothetical protein
VTPELEAVLGRALEKDKHQRYANVGLFALGLAPFAPASRIHAERAARVLAITDAEIPSPNATRIPSVVSSDQPTLNGASAVSSPAEELGKPQTFPSSPKPMSEKSR